MLSIGLLWILVLLGTCFLVVMLYHSFGVVGLFGWIAVVSVVANMNLQNFVEVFGYSFTLGNIVYATAFLITDILCENHGKRVAYHGVFFGFVIFVLINLIVQIPAIIELPKDTRNFFTITMFLFPRATIAGIGSYLLSQLLNVQIYIFIKRRISQKRYLWVRNNVSTMISQFFDTLIFTGVAVLGIVPFSQIFEIILSTFVFKVVFALLDTPWIYAAKSIGMKQDRSSTLDWLR